MSSDNKTPPTYRGLRSTDSVDISNIMSLPGVVHGLSSLPYTSELHVQHLMSDVSNKHWVIAEHKGKAVGFIYLSWPNGRWRRVAEIAMGVADNYAGQGVGFSLLKRALHTGFLYLDFERIELVVYQDNVPAITIYKKCGLQSEGSREGQVIREGIYYDSHLMGITREQYLEHQDEI